MLRLTWKTQEDTQVAKRAFQVYRELGYTARDARGQRQIAFDPALQPPLLTFHRPQTLFERLTEDAPWD